ncbi:MAG: (E)-4-hydroxy-3-methylbut-2-enyl-diphosphate synthase [Firmicutes bacterium]|nr:(E)-4-hydroxy-3-methylbut-2-enyl-diphosphate synthase [Bacillota bacterium]
MMNIKTTRTIKVGLLTLGGGNRILIQSMTNTDTADAAATSAQVRALAFAGCDIVRIAVCSMEELAACIPLLRGRGQGTGDRGQLNEELGIRNEEWGSDLQRSNSSDTPHSSLLVPNSLPPSPEPRAPSPIALCADIQYDYRLAVACADAGFHKIRFNPGNIGGEKAVAEVVAACKANRVPIRIGVNMGSLEKEAEQKFGRTAKALAESALNHARLLEKCGFYDTVLSVKASDVKTMIAANRILAEKSDYPLHIGVTESGAGEYGLVKSAIGIGALLADGIGDTVRVSLTGDPVREIEAVRMILKATGKLDTGAEIISCPTCSRCKCDLSAVVADITEYAKPVRKPLKIAVMGCAVNGPGEAKDADLGVAFGPEKAAIFEKGKVVKTVKSSDAAAELKKIIESSL